MGHLYQLYPRLSRLRDYQERQSGKTEAVDEYKERVFSGCKNSAVQDPQSMKPDENPSIIGRGG